MPNNDELLTRLELRKAALGFAHRIPTSSSAAYPGAGSGVGGVPPVPNRPTLAPAWERPSRPPRKKLTDDEYAEIAKTYRFQKDELGRPCVPPLSKKQGEQGRNGDLLRFARHLCDASRVNIRRNMPIAQLGPQTRRALIDQGFEVKEFGKKDSWMLSEDTPRARDAVQPGLNVAQGAAASVSRSSDVPHPAGSRQGGGESVGSPMSLNPAAAGLAAGSFTESDAAEVLTGMRNAPWASPRSAPKSNEHDRAWKSPCGTYGSGARSR